MDIAVSSYLQVILRGGEGGSSFLGLRSSFPSYPYVRVLTTGSLQYEWFCSRKRHVETPEERRKWGESRGAGRGQGERFLSSPPPRSPSFALAPTLRVTISTLPSLPLL